MKFVRTKYHHPPALEAFMCMLSVLLLLIAYTSHLGYLPLNTDTDEARRALVTAEMMISGDYLTPTINGQLYLNKPPLYNWIVSVWFQLFGDYSMFAFRIQVIMAVSLFSGTIYYFTRKYTSPFIAFFSAMAFATNGRILIYDSLQGLIDTTFAWLVYTGFMLVYFFGERKKYTLLFIITYLITAAGFMMKGLPSLIFQGITLLTYFTWKKQFKYLFKPAHFISIFLFLIIIGSYYYFYFTKNNLPPETLFGNLFEESAKRTGLEFGIGAVLLHILTFPFETLYHYAPWMIMVVLLFSRIMRISIKQQPFLQFNLLVFFFNFIVYWTSPQVYARYLFMFLPLLFVVFFSLYQSFKRENSGYIRFLNGLFTVMCFVLLLASFALPFSTYTKFVDNYLIRTVILVFSFAVICFIAIKYRQLKLHSFLLAVIVFRIGFNWFVIEQRGARDLYALHTAEKIAAVSNGKPLYILKDAKVGNFDGMSFHLSTRRNEILKYDSIINHQKYFIIDTSQIIPGKTEIIFGFTHPKYDSLLFVQFSDTLINR